MFDSIQQSRRRRPRILLLLSIAAHAVGLTFLVATGLWRIDKLGVEAVPLAIASPPAGLGMAADEPEAKRPVKQHGKRLRRDLPASQHAAADSRQGEDTDTGSDDTGGPGEIGTGILPCEGCSGILDQAAKPTCGNGRVEAGEECDDGNRTANDGCSASCRADKERILPPRLIEGQRIEGEPKIAPPETVKQALARSGLDRLVATVKMCIDKEGGVRSLRVLRSTGFSEYDQRLLSGMRTWRYRPYKLDSGAAVSVCTVVTFIYQAR